MIRSLTIRPKKLVAARHRWFWAETFEHFNRTGLVVYKSVALRDFSPMFREVREFLEHNQLQIIYKGIFNDAELMFGEGEYSVYITPVSPGDEELEVSVDPETKDLALAAS